MTITDTVKQKKPKHKLLEKYTIKERTRKQKADIFMGIVFQIYLCIPWININGKYNTIHMYLIKAFRQNDYVDIYIQTFLKNHTWPQQYSRMAALIFLLAIIAMLLVQCLELFKLYQNIKGINNSNYLLAIGIAWFAVFYIFLAALDAHSEGLIRNIFSIFLEHIKHKKQKKYYKNLLMNHRFYYRMNTVSRYILFFSLMSFLSCFYFGIQFISTINAEKAESLYPYDFMCVADKSDDKLFEKIKEKYHATLTEYPMVRVANADKTEHLEGRGEIIIQGQQIGISESTYYKLKKAVDPSYKKKSLNLDKNGKKVYVVHQQDRATKAQPVDWYYNKNTPTLHIGLPCEYCDYADHETTYDKKIVAGEEISSLTGCYSTPKCENLIVFSDEYFKKAQNEWKDIEALTGFKLERYKAMYGDDGEPYIIEGPTKLVFIQTDKKYIDQIDKELESKEERHKYIGNYDSTVKFHYLSKTAITDMKTERAVKSMICVYIIITLSILNWIMLYAMNEMEKKEKTEREKFLVSMGMDRKERKKMNKREWYIYWIIPTIILIISTILFMQDTMAARMYSGDIRKICELQETGVVAVWIVINGIYFWIMNRKARRGIENHDK